MEVGNISLRGQTALGLLIAEFFEDCPDVILEDRELAKRGIALAWRWVEGQQLDPDEICEYIDGEINLPIRSTDYVAGSKATDLMMSAVHAIGLVALYACEEASVQPSESVGNFGGNEWNLLQKRVDKLDERGRENIMRIEKILVSMAGREESNSFGTPILKADLIACAA